MPLLMIRSPTAAVLLVASEHHRLPRQQDAPRDADFFTPMIWQLMDRKTRS